ncbi:MAG: hypothetical protein ABI844_11275 [Saprospiraceae bacterium]
MQSSISLCDLPWWAVLLSWLLPAILGYLWGMLQWSRYKSKSKRFELELSSASKRIVNLENEVNECRMSYDKVVREKSKLVEERNDRLAKIAPIVSGGTPSQSVNQGQEIIHDTKSVYGYAIRRNDLKLIEGIDPKIEKLLHNIGINDWYSLESVDINYLMKVLNDEGYTQLDPKSWPYQSSLARQEKWAELKAFQSQKN